MMHVEDRQLDLPRKNAAMSDIGPCALFLHSVIYFTSREHPALSLMYLILLQCAVGGLKVAYLPVHHTADSPIPTKEG